MQEPRFILPPHPGQAQRIRREDLPIYENMNRFVAQRKFNGTHVVIWICQDQVVLWDRRGIPLTLYQLTPSQRINLLSLKRDKDKELVLAGECLHTKAKSKITGQQVATDTIVLFDILYYDKHLTGHNQVERLDFLSSICGDPVEQEPGNFPGSTSRALVVKTTENAHLWLAEVFYEEFSYHFDECFDEDKEGRDKYPEIEGLMLRVRNSRLAAGTKGDVEWLIRCRKAKDKTYMF